jgi:hypothetical protein
MKKLRWIGLAALVLSFSQIRAAAQFAYGPAALSGLGIVNGFNTDQTGNFTPLAGSPFGPNAQFSAMLVNPVTNLLYVYYFASEERSDPKRIQGRVQPYRVDAAGTPVPVGHPTVYYPPAVPSGLFLVSTTLGLMDPSGKYLCIVNTTTDDEGFGAGTQLSFLRIEKSGSVIYTPKDVYPFGSGVQIMAGHPSGAFFFGEDNSTVFGYRVESNYTLTPISPPTLAGPWSIGFDPSGKYFYEFYSPTPEPTLALAVFTVGSDGTLTPIPGSPFRDSTGGFDVTNPLFFHPSGKYVYALGYPPTTGQGSSIYAYSIANNGQFVPLSGSPYALPGAAVIAPGLTMAMDPGGNFIVVSDQSYNPSNANWVYLIQPDGTLQPRANSPSNTIPAIDCFVGNPE